MEVAVNGGIKASYVYCFHALNRLFSSHQPLEWADWHLGIHTKPMPLYIFKACIAPKPTIVGLASQNPGNDRQESRMKRPHVDGPCASVPPDLGLRTRLPASSAISPCVTSHCLFPSFVAKFTFVFLQSCALSLFSVSQPLLRRRLCCSSARTTTLRRSTYRRLAKMWLL